MNVHRDAGIVGLGHRVCSLYHKMALTDVTLAFGTLLVGKGTKKKIYELYKKRNICTLYFDCFFVPKMNATTWRIASFSKVLHSLKDTVLNVEEGVGQGYSMNCEFLLGSNYVLKETVIRTLVCCSSRWLAK